MTIAERNRALKKILETAFGRGKVSVRGSRGTAYGYVTASIDWTPLDVDQRREMEALVWQLIRKAGIDKHIGTYGYDDPGSDYGYGSELSIGFNSPRYYRTMKHSDGTMSGQRDRWDDKWETIGAKE